MKIKSLIVGMLAFLCLSEGYSQTGVPDLTWYGDGSASEFHISTADQLAGLCELSNGFKLGSEPVQFVGKTIVLKNDIDLSCYGKGYNFMGGTGWYPIGDTNTSCFHGIFDGNGKTIRNLFIDRNDSKLEYIGLFGFIGSGGVVKNLTVENVDISNAATEHDFPSVGSVAGYFMGDDITGCYVTGRIYSKYGEAGGIAGGCGGRINNCYFKGVVDGDRAGGITGLLQKGYISNCLTDGVVYGSFSAGGITGGMEGFGFGGEVSNCISLCKIGFYKIRYSHLTLAGIACNGSYGVVKNCIALNPSVVDEDGYEIGRVSNSSSSCRNLLAFEGMECNAVTFDKHHMGKDGESRTAKQLQTIDGFLPQFASAPWTYETGMLPGLFGKPISMPEYLKDNSSVVEITAEQKVFVADGMLYIEGLTAQEVVAVYDSMGRVVYSGFCDGTMQLPLADKGLYVVKFEDKCIKVLN